MSREVGDFVKARRKAAKKLFSLCFCNEKHRKMWHIRISPPPEESSLHHDRYRLNTSSYHHGDEAIDNMYTDRDVGMISILYLDKFNVICYNVPEVLLVEPIRVFDIFG